MGLLTALNRWLKELVRPENKSMNDNQRYFADRYRDLVLRLGPEVSVEMLTNARSFGLNVEALIEEHKRRAAASWCVEFSLDLAKANSKNLLLNDTLTEAGIPDREIPSHGSRLCVDLGSLFKRIDLPDRTMSIKEIVMHGVEAVHQRLNDGSNDFPKNRFPHGAEDWMLTSLRWNETERAFHLSGTWKEAVREQRPSKVNPGCSIDLRRTPPLQKGLVSALPMPDLNDITLRVWRWPNGRHEVIDVFAYQGSCPPSRKAEHPEQADTLRLTFPSTDLPQLEWKLDWFRARSPAMDFLFQRCMAKNGKPSDWLHLWSREALFDNYEKTGPVTDLRASLISGPTGPAPLPKGMQWPRCPHCGEVAAFSQSVDVRDIGFADLLAGTTMVIFVCNECLETGDWSDCSAVVWLQQTDEIVLTDRGEASPVLQISQCYGAELLETWELPKEISIEIEAIAESSDFTFYALPLSYGTKVGGVPSYLQEEQVFYDRNGTVMEYIAQINPPGHIATGGLGYVFFSVATQETYIDFQDT
jgi:hypothetical protein